MICVIGGANIDIQGFSDNNIILHDSNPGYIEKGFGGVARNIAENISKLGCDVKFIAPIGDDVFSKSLINYMNNLNIDISHSLFLKNTNLSTYLSILDSENEMVLAISSMKILENLNLEYIKSKENILKNSKIIVCDTNLNTDVLEYISTNFENTILDLVSTTKALKVKDFIGNFNTIKANKLEVEILSGIKIENFDDILKAGLYLIEKGTSNIFITLGKDGIFYINNEGHLFIENPKITVKDITGAGDAFTSGIAYSMYNNFDINKTAKVSLSMSLINVSNVGTCPNALNLNLLNDYLTKYFKEVL